MLDKDSDRNDEVEVSSGDQERLDLVRHAQQARDAAEAAEAKLRAAYQVIASAQEGIVVLDRGLRIELWNRFMEELLGLPADQVVGRYAAHVYAGGDAAGLVRLLRRALRGETVRSTDLPFGDDTSARQGWISATFAPRRDMTGKVVGVIAILTDISERRRAAEMLAGQNRILEMVAQGDPLPDLLRAIVRFVEERAENTIVSIQLLDENGTAIRYAIAPGLPDDFNSSMVGLSIGPKVGSCGAAMFFQKRVIVPDIAVDPRWDDYRAAALTAGLRSCWSVPIMSADGLVLGSFAVYTRDVHTPDEAEIDLVGVGVHLAGIAIARTLSEEALQWQAMYDALTALPNRSLLHDRLQQAIFTAQRERNELSLLLMDLDRFKEINDTFGHQYGDLLLQQMGARLKDGLREADTVARLGGDEFAVLLPGTDANGAGLAADKLLQTLRLPFLLEGQPFDVAASIGIAVFPRHGTDSSTLLRRADVAMYAAKAADSGQALYSLDQDQYSPARLSLIRQLHSAIEQDQLLLHFQPQIHLATGCRDHVEALVRWNHPEHGLLLPGDFIPLAEHTGVIRELTIWVLDAAIKQCRSWHNQDLDVQVAINLSPRNLHDPHLVDGLTHLLAAHKADPSWLTLELTESTVMTDPERAMAVLRRLHDIGVSLCIDDFGTGYSSLAYLKQLPVDEIKIDRSFVKDMATDENDVVIARSVIDLGHNLGLVVVAEGVETEAAWKVLSDMGCDMAQGYYLSAPLPPEHLEDWLRATHGRQHAHV